jgi:hypothetical protein
MSLLKEYNVLHVLLLSIRCSNNRLIAGLDSRAYSTTLPAWDNYDQFSRN